MFLYFHIITVHHPNTNTPDSVTLQPETLLCLVLFYVSGRRMIQCSLHLYSAPIILIPLNKTQYNKLPSIVT